MLASHYKKKNGGRKKRKISDDGTEPEGTFKSNAYHKKLFLQLCAQNLDKNLDEKQGVGQGVSQNAKKALYHFELLEHNGKEKFHELISQGISDAILNENFSAAELLLVHFKMSKLESFSCRQILLALFMVMKTMVNKKGGDDDRIEGTARIAKLNKKLMTKIIDLESFCVPNKNLLWIAPKTIPKHGLLFCHQLLKSMNYSNASGANVWYYGYRVFEQVMDCFSEEDIISVITGRESDAYNLLLLGSEKISPKTFCTLYTAWLSALNCYCCQGGNWYQRHEWYKTYQNTKTVNLLEKLCFLCDAVPPDVNRDSKSDREFFAREIIQGVLDDEGNNKDLLEDHGFTIKNFLFLETAYPTLTAALEETIKLDEFLRKKFQKRCDEITSWYVNIIAENTGICFDVAKIIVNLVVTIRSVPLL